MNKTRNIKKIFIKLIEIAVLLGVCFVTARIEKISWYLGATVVVVLTCVFSFIEFERKRVSAREIAILSSCVAIAVASRAVFYFAPQIKPIGAVCILVGICFGKENGFVVGETSMLLSNFIFGQGVTTPFQMVGMGMTVYICSLIADNKKIRTNRYALSLCCAGVQFVFYGVSVDLCSCLMLATTLKSILTVLLNGAVFNLVFALTTFVCLCLLAPSFIKRTDRIKMKYGVFNNEKVQ